MNARIAGIAIALSIVAVTVTACGGSDDGGKGEFGGKASSSAESGKSANQILTDAQNSIASTRSVHAKGNIGDETFDVVMTPDGHTEGTAVGSKGPLHFIVIGPDEVYGATDSHPGKFVKIAADDAKNIAGTYNKDTLVTTAMKPTGTLTKGKISTINGQQAIGLKSSVGGTLYVTDDSSHPYPLRLSNPGKAEINYNDWDKDVRISAPPTSSGS